MIVPIVNINGSKREDLVEQNFQVYQALDVVLQTMRRAAPNGRDFQLQSADELRAAREEFDAHAEKVRQVRDHFHGLAIAINEGGI